MGKAAASASSSTGIQATGGNITKNSPSLWVVAIVAVVVLFYLYKKGGR